MFIWYCAFPQEKNQSKCLVLLLVLQPPSALPLSPSPPEETHDVSNTCSRALLHPHTTARTHARRFIDFVPCCWRADCSLLSVLLLLLLLCCVREMSVYTLILIYTVPIFCCFSANYSTTYYLMDYLRHFKWEERKRNGRHERTRSPRTNWRNFKWNYLRFETFTECLRFA